MRNPEDAAWGGATRRKLGLARGALVSALEALSESPDWTGLKQDLQDALDATAQEQFEPCASDRVVAAWLLDRAEQYRNDSPARALLDELMLGAAKGEHRAAFAHGELDNLMQRPFIRDAAGGCEPCCRLREGHDGGCEP